MQDPAADQALRKHFNSKSRKVKKDRNHYLVPLRYDAAGKVLTEETFDARKHYKKLTLDDWAFLEAWKRNDYDAIKTQDDLALSAYDLTRLVQKLECFKREEIQDKALATIPTASFIQARHTENVLGGAPLDDSQRDSLKELAKITGAYKSTTQINVQNNVFQMPTLTPAEQQALKAFADKMADVQEAQLGS